MQRRRMQQRIRKFLTSGAPAAIASALGGVAFLSPAAAQELAAGQAETGADWTSRLGSLDPLLVGAGGAMAIAVAAVLLAVRVASATKNQSLHWSKRLAEMEARLEKSDAVLSAHPGLVLVWEDDTESLNDGWGDPKILGGPAALASLLSFCRGGGEAEPNPVNQLLGALGHLPLEDDEAEKPLTLREKIHDLRAHGVAFSGNVVTPDGRSIEVDGRIAGGQVALWITDPAVRMAEDGGVIGAVRERAVDLHGSHALLERMASPAWRRNAEMEIVWANRAYIDMVEAASLSDVLKQQIEIDNANKKLAAKAAADRSPCEQRIVINSRGERRVLRIIETPLHGSGDAALGGFAVDITELDKTKVDLRQHIEANQRTLDQIHTAVAIFGASQNLVYHNRAFQELWALEDAQLGGRTYHGEILDHLRVAGRLPEPPDYDEWKREQLALYTEDLSGPDAGREGGAPDEIWHLPDGRALRVSKQRHPLGGVMAAFEDITESLELEARYNTQIKVQKATLNNLAEGVAVFGADGALRLYNKAFQKLWRLDAATLDKRPHIDAILGQLESRTRQGEKPLSTLRKCVTSKSPEDREPLSATEIILEDGRTLAFGTEPLPDGATLAHFLNVTDSKEREKDLKERNAILENSDRLKSKFVDHVSYQLRTPLSTIIGFSEMLDGQMFGVLNDRQKDYIASVLSASYHLRDLINDIIDLAAIDAGKLELDLKSADIRTLLESAATFAALKAEDTQVTLKVDCAKDIGSAEIDERRIKQVLFNLLSNAFAYTSAGGTVTLGANRAGGALKIWVRDTGRGLSPADQAKAFDAFESRGPSAGAGIGLALVERFVKLHNGWVRMDSQQGEGASITCFLPDRAAKPRLVQPPAETASPAPEDANEKPRRKPRAKKTAAKTTRRKTTRKTARGAKQTAHAAE